MPFTHMADVRRTTCGKIFLYGTTILLLFVAQAAMGSASRAEKQVFDQLNQEREHRGLKALEWNDQVAEAARNHSRALAENARLSHQFSREPALQARLAALGVRFTVSAENVASTEYVEDAHLALMNSPGHRANILSAAYNTVGIGVVEQKGKIYVTEDFVSRVPVYSEAQFGAALAESLRLKGTWQIDARPDPRLHELACSTNGDLAKVAEVAKGKYLVVFTSSEPRLPDRLRKAASEGGYYRMNFGVCFRPDAEHGSGNFWVVAALSGS